MKENLGQHIKHNLLRYYLADPQYFFQISRCDKHKSYDQQSCNNYVWARISSISRR